MAEESTYMLTEIALFRLLFAGGNVPCGFSQKDVLGFDENLAVVL